MKNDIFNYLESLRKKNGYVKIGLIDPDAKNENMLNSIINNILDMNFDAILVGGSLIMDEKYNQRLEYIKKSVHLPVILFPNSSSDIYKHADAILFLSLLSSKYPQYLIGEHIKSSPIIKKMNIECIPTAYILIEGEKRTAVEIISHTNPIPPDQIDIIEAYALASQYLGNKFIYFEMGSGASSIISTQLIEHVYSLVDIPIMIGGGIKNDEDIQKLIQAGASYVVSGTMIEKMANE